MSNVPLHNSWKEIINKKVLHIVVDGNSYSFDESEMKILSYLNLYDQFEIDIISTKSKSDKRTVANLYRPEFKDRNEIIIIKDNAKKIRLSSFRDEKIKEILPIELIAGITLGDIVITKTNIMKRADLNNIKAMFYCSLPFIGSLSECYSAIRPWVNMHSELTIEIGKFSYIYSKWLSVTMAEHILVPNSRDAWRAAVSIKDDKYQLAEGALIDYLYAISLRVKHLITTRDILETKKIGSYRSIGDRTEDYPYFMIYYYGYALILCTAIIDSICRIANWRIGGSNKDEREITIRKISSNYDRCMKKISQFSKELSDFISLEDNQSFIEMIYQLRNYIAHNTLPGSMMLSGNFQGLYGDLIMIKGKISEKIEEFYQANKMTKKEIIGIGIEGKRESGQYDFLLEPVLFVRYIAMRVFEILDNIFRHLSLEKKMITEEEEIKQYNSLETAKIETGKEELFEKVDQALIAMEASVP